jgi:hypothetical protein
MEIYKYCCDCCDKCIIDERDCFLYEPSDLKVCEHCFEVLCASPIDADEVDNIADMLEEMTMS